MVIVGLGLGFERSEGLEGLESGKACQFRVETLEFGGQGLQFMGFKLQILRPKTIL